MLTQPAPAIAIGETTPDVATPIAQNDVDPGLVMTCCANCGKQMIDRKCKMICECGYFLSCSDYY